MYSFKESFVTKEQLFEILGWPNTAPRRRYTASLLLLSFSVFVFVRNFFMKAGSNRSKGYCLDQRPTCSIFQIMSRGEPRARFLIMFDQILAINIPDSVQCYPDLT